MLDVSFMFMFLLMQLLMLIHSCSKFATFILTLEKSELKIWIHIKHCLSSAIAIPIQETQNLHCIVAAASDVESDAWLASFIFFENFCSKIFGTTLQDVYTMPNTFIQSLNCTKRILYSCYWNLLQIGNVHQDLSILVIKLTTLKRKIIQRSIHFESDLILCSGFSQV